MKEMSFYIPLSLLSSSLKWKKKSFNKTIFINDKSSFIQDSIFYPHLAIFWSRNPSHLLISKTSINFMAYKIGILPTKRVECLLRL